ncbi:PAXNEB-domain-containing protein [Rhizoclosmatium globosum]|uniref:Elongator complex protein 4 n=1 Tax=Rhizoclosmatium globosum TaxID=329046 RepID=A0A1Y2BY90_9FUNG|nr:PAXNEB-domain-containing protein [Rhizoclosmatium globosum]|eukprot:ORY39035.1 PAXNEB-domain-containing protein [Rhizoclosmatium globosum]
MSSFRKRTPGTGPTGAGGAAAAATAAPRGTRVSGFNGRTTVSSGIASLDSSIGDLLVGTVTVVERDRGSGYSSLVLKYFCAQGLAAAHVLCLASTDDPEAFVRTLMKVAKDDDDDSSQNDPDDADDAPLTQPGPRTLGSLRDTTRLNIAWRYQNMPTLNAAQQKASSASLKGLGPYCSQFDITKQMDEATLNTASIALVNVNEWVQLTSKQLYQNLYSAIVGIIQKGSFKNSDSNSAPTILRIAIDDIGGPTWGSDAGSPTSIHALIWFLSKLRLLVRESRAVVMCTLSSFLYSNHLVGVSTNPYVSLIRHAVDTVLEVESFSGELVK